MARRIIIGEILNLIKGLGGNPKNYMGTKTNINFLGKGPKESLFQGQIDIDGLMQSGFPLERVISEAERAGGYVSANKLNDLQLQRLRDNLVTLKKAYFPEQIPNITDLGTGTGGLTQEGLGSLRQKSGIQNIIDKKFGKGYFGSVTDDLDAVPTAGGLMSRIEGRMKNIKEMAEDRKSVV